MSDDNRFKKDNMLPFLYFIRATLSQMSAWQDEGEEYINKNKELVNKKIDKYNQESNDHNSKVKKSQESIENNLSYIEGRKNLIEKEKNSIEFRREKLASGPYKTDTARKDYSDFISGSKRLLLPLGIVCALVGIVLGIALWTVPRWEDTSENLFLALNNLGHIVGGIFFGLLGGIAVVLIIVFVIPTIIYPIYSASSKGNENAKSARSFEKHKEEYKKEIAEAEERIKQYEKDIKDAEGYNRNFADSIAISKSKDSYTLSLIEEENKKELEFEKKVRNSIAELCNDLYGEAKVIVGDILDPRDWGFVDLLIYMFETGRADTKKEALNHIDEVRRQEQLVRALQIGFASVQQSIRESASYITNSFASQMGILRSTILSSARETSEQIKNLTKETSGITSSINAMSSSFSAQQQELAKSLMGKIDENTIQEGMNSSLLKKVNETTEKMYNESKDYIHRNHIYTIKK